MKNIDLDLFSQYVGERFVLEVADNTTTRLVLLEVKDLGNGKPQPQGQTKKTQTFSLIFQGSPDVFLEQKTYALSHPKMGAFDLFLVPIAQNEEGYAYEAVFN